MILLFAFAAFLSAALLFVVEPMTGKMLLPVLGGAAAVWNTCLVFFQIALLLGYLYAHLSTRWLGARRQALVHIGLLLIPFVVLPISLSQHALATVPRETSPVLWLIVFLAMSVGLPFFVVATSAPLLQRWFAHNSTHNPYALYAASNAGSLVGLLSYPLLWERSFNLSQLNRLWAFGYGGAVVMMALCAMVRLRSPRPEVLETDDRSEPISWERRARWVLLAFVPSSLMLGVTTYIATDVASVPLLWVVPLALYLVTFVLVFARRPWWPPSWLGRALSLVVAVVLVAMIVEATHPPGLLIPLHLLAFFSAAWIGHAELAKDRPSPAKLTEFYLWLSVGGVLGGMFNTLLGPLLFSRVLEYPLVLVLACALRPGPGPGTGWRVWVGPASVGVLAAVLILAGQATGLAVGRVSTLLFFGLPALLAYRYVTQPRRYGAALLALLMAGAVYTGAFGRVVLVERNFFGVLRVTDDLAARCRVLVHGSTLHGRQSLDPARRGEPLSYFHRSGPVGQVFALAPPSREVAVIGLGAGALACYAQPEQRWTFYEIDPAVESIARDTRYFTYLEDCRARALRVVLGDARLRLAEAADQQYGLIVLDAFSSDAIPVHLLTREALRLYATKLAPGGWLAFHITNRCLDLRPVVANLAANAGLVALCRDDRVVSEDGCDPSRWVVLARPSQKLASLMADARWQPLRPRREMSLWTDDFSNIISVLHWE